MHFHSRLRESRARLFIASTIAAMSLALRAAPAHAAGCPQPRVQDELWLVSCRGLQCGDPAEQAGKLTYWRYDRQQAWTRSTLADLVATDDPGQVTIVFLHGNRITSGEAFTKGWSAYRTLTARADERPVRFVIWSWPSEPIQGLLQDARIKAARTDPSGYYLAWFLDQLNPEVPVSLWAHSFGARIVTAALHLMGGGTVRGKQLDNRSHASRQAMQVVFLAAALDSNWLLPGHRQGRALSQVGGMLLVNNYCDALLKRYHRLYRCGWAQALGYTGLAKSRLAARDRDKVCQFDASGYLGRQHQFVGYLCSPALVARMRPYLLFDNQAASRAPVAQVAEAAADEPAVVAQ